MAYCISDEIKAELSALADAIEQKDYPLIYEELGRFTAPFSHEAAFYLLDNALRCDLKPEVFEAILANSPPLPEIACPTSVRSMMIISIFREGKFYRDIAGDYGLLEIAAGRDRADLLSLFLERGAGPNRTGSYDYMDSPLEAAVQGGALNCLELLMRQPGLDTTWTSRLMGLLASREWAHSELKECCRIMAPRFTWVRLSGYPLPIPEPMKPWIIADMANWPLLECFCRERGPISYEDGCGTIWALADEIINRQTESEAACAALTALLESCPDLLRGEEECQALLRCFFAFAFGNARERLRPWVNSLNTRQILMGAENFLPYGGGKHFLDLWRKLLPNGPALAINRWNEQWANNLDPQDEETISYVLNDCQIRGEGKKGKLSPLAAKVLHHGSLSVLLPLLRRSDGLFAAEDPDALLRHVLYRTAGGSSALVAEKIKKLSSAPAERTPEQTLRLVEKLLILQNLCP